MMKVFSFSRLDTYDMCPRRFYYKYVLGWEDVPGLPAIFGKTVHKAIEYACKGCSLEDAVTTAWIEEAGIPEITKDEILWNTRNALSIVQGEGIIEEHFVIELTEDVHLQGYIDRIELGTGRVIDWKTGRLVQNVLDKKQLPLYSYHVLQKYSFAEVEAVLFYTRNNTASSEMIDLVMAESAVQWAVQTAVEIQQKLDIITAMTKNEILQFAFPPKPGSACSICRWGWECIENT